MWAPGMLGEIEVRIWYKNHSKTITLTLHKEAHAMEITLNNTFETSDRGIKLTKIELNGTEVLARHNPKLLARVGTLITKTNKLANDQHLPIPAEMGFRRLVKRPFNVNWDLVSVKGEMGIAETAYDGRTGVVDLYFISASTLATTVNGIDIPVLLELFRSIIDTHMMHGDAQKLLEEYMLC